MIWLMLVLGIAQAQDCENIEWIANAAEEYVANFLLRDAQEALERAETAYACSPPAEPAVLARLYLAQGSVSFFSDDPAQARMAYLAAHRTDPTVWTEFYGDDAKALYDDQAQQPPLADGKLKFLPVPVGYDVFVDGLPIGDSNKAPAGIHLVQIQIPQGDTVFAAQVLLPEKGEVLITTGLRPGPPTSTRAEDAVNPAMGEEQFLEMLASASELQRAARRTEAWIDFGFGLTGGSHRQGLSLPGNEMLAVKSVHSPVMAIGMGVDLLQLTVSLRGGVELMEGQYTDVDCFRRDSETVCQLAGGNPMELVLQFNAGLDLWLLKRGRLAWGLGVGAFAQQPTFQGGVFAAPAKFGGSTTVRYALVPHRWALVVTGGATYLPYPNPDVSNIETTGFAFDLAHVFAEADLAIRYIF